MRFGKYLVQFKYSFIQSRIDVYKRQNQGRVELMRRPLEEYPRNYEFMNYLARSLYRCYNIDLHSTEIIMLCDRILEECKTDSIRFSALQTIARTYNDIGQ